MPDTNPVVLVVDAPSFGTSLVKHSVVSVPSRTGSVCDARSHYPEQVILSKRERFVGPVLFITESQGVALCAGS